MASFFPHPWFPAFDGSFQGGGGGGAAPTHFVAGVIASSSSPFSSSIRHVAGHLRDRWAAQIRVLLLPPSLSESFNFDGNLNGKVSSLKKLLDFEAVSDVLSASVCSSWFSFSSVRGDDSGFRRKQNLQFGSSQKKPFDRRLWTNVLLAVNVLAYAAQIATQGKLLYWGAKVNSLIDQGQLWRLVTSSLLHANIGHLMINCYSLNSIGPTMEQLTGPRRFLAIYCTSAIASSLMSYKFCRSPAVGASGAIFGLVGSFAVFILRHRKLIASGKNDLLHVGHVIALNMAIGFLSRGIDNWGHFGGLLGGAAVSWFLGPTWKYQFQTKDGRSVYADQAPVIQLLNWRKRLS